MPNDANKRIRSVTICHAYGIIVGFCFFDKDKNRISSTITDIAYRGRGYEHAIETKYGSLTGVFDTMSHPRGRTMEVSIDPERCIAFPHQPKN